jgi:hypothetical protein
MMKRVAKGSLDCRGKGRLERLLGRRRKGAGARVVRRGLVAVYTLCFCLMSASAFKLQLATVSKSTGADWKVVEGRGNHGIGTDYLYSTSNGTSMQFRGFKSKTETNRSRPPFPFLL